MTASTLLRAGQRYRPTRTDPERMPELKMSRDTWTEWLTKVFEGQRTDLVTLTFAPRSWECDQYGPTGPTRSRVGRAGSRFERLLTRALARPSFFIVRELGGMNGRAHLHSIVCSEDGSVIRAAISSHAAKDGFVKLSMRTGSPTEYVTKYVSKSDGDWWRAGGPLFGDHPLGVLGSGGVLVGLPRAFRYVTDARGRYL